MCLSESEPGTHTHTHTHKHTPPHSPRAHRPPRARTRAHPDTHTHSDHTRRSGREPGWLRRQRGAGGGESPAAGGAREPRALRTVPAELAGAAAPSGGRRSCRSRARRPAHPLQRRPTPPPKPEGFAVPSWVARRRRKPASGPRAEGRRGGGQAASRGSREGGLSDPAARAAPAQGEPGRRGCAAAAGAGAAASRAERAVQPSARRLQDENPPRQPRAGGWGLGGSRPPSPGPSPEYRILARDP